ncbi:MAG: 50S ribosomal protein L25 [Candidatus Makana argininalis]
MLIINAEFRKHKGKGYSRKLRLNNIIPSVIYGLNKKSYIITINQNFLSKNKIIKYLNNKNLIINIKGKKIKVKIQEIQKHSFKPKIIHIDFIRIENINK